MSRDVVVGITVKGKDQTSGVLDKVKVAGTSMGKGIESAVERAKATMKTLSIVATGLNQGFELAKKAARAAKEGFDATVGAALEQRSAMDGQRLAWERFGTEIAKTQGFIGD